MKRLHALLLLAALVPLAGCRQTVVAAAAPPPPPLETVSVPPPDHPTEPLPEEPTVDANVSPAPVIPTPRPAPPPRRRPTTPTPPPTQTASAAPPPIDLGQLTTGGEATGTLRQQTDDLLKAQNRRLAGVPTAVVALHSQQIEQARLFLRQADDAWKKLDVDGAHTLAVKAKVLLDEVLQ